MTITVVADVIAAAKAEIKAQLDPIFGVDTFTQLSYEYDLEKNSFQGNKKGFGFIPDVSPFEESGTFKRVTMSHTFQMILTEGFKNQDNDTAQSAATQLLYEASSDLLAKLINRKLGISGTVILVSGINVDAPEFLNKNSVVALRTNMVVRYRYSTS